MEFKTKFNLGETIVAIQDNKCIEFTINSVHISASKRRGKDIFGFITYYGNKTAEGNEQFYADENQCFPSKEEYINQL